MNNQETELFLDTYKQLETAAEALVGSDSRSSSIIRLARLPAFSEYREELDYCRQVRNLLAHEAKIDGEYGVHPGRSMQAVLTKVFRMVEHPPTVADFMTPTQRMLTAGLQDRVLPLLEQMERRGISYVPLLQSGVVTGVFSLKAIIRCMLAGLSVDETTPLAALADYLPPERDKGLQFVAPALSLEKGRTLFQTIHAKNQRVTVLLVTGDGRRDRPLLGIVSPYDLLKEE